jgi:hypothetical protein
MAKASLSAGWFAGTCSCPLDTAVRLHGCWSQAVTLTDPLAGLPITLFS